VAYRNLGDGRFEDVTFASGLGHLQKGHAVAFGDVDNDGDQELFQQLGGAFPFDKFGNALYDNPGSDNAWIVLRLEGRGAPPERIEHGETVVHRFVGWTFLALAAYVTVKSGLLLWGGQPPGQSLAGIVLAIAALIVMTLLARAKLRVAEIMGSRALRAEAKESLACMYLAAALLFGLAAHAAFGWWWADPAAALLMVPWLLQEGREALTGEGACCQVAVAGPGARTDRSGSRRNN